MKSPLHDILQIEGNPVDYFSLRDAARLELKRMEEELISVTADLVSEHKWSQEYFELSEKLQVERTALVQDNERLCEVARDLLNQACLKKDGTLEDYCMSAYENAIDYFLDAGELEGEPPQWKAVAK